MLLCVCIFWVKTTYACTIKSRLYPIAVDCCLLSSACRPFAYEQWPVALGLALPRPWARTQVRFMGWLCVHDAALLEESQATGRQAAHGGPGAQVPGNGKET